jgi:hypothetical protein
MKKLVIGFVCLVALGTSVSAEENSYSQCIDWCKAKYAGKTFDTDTLRGACSAGCSNAHWTNSEKGKSTCIEEYKGCNVFLEKACQAGSAQYGK